MTHLPKYKSNPEQLDRAGGRKVSNPAFIRWTFPSSRGRLAEELRGEFQKATLVSGGEKRNVQPYVFMHINGCCVDTLRRLLLCLCSCISKSDMLIWKGSAGIIDTAATCGRVKRQTPHCLTARPKKKEKWLSLHGISIHWCPSFPTLGSKVDLWFFCRQGCFLLSALTAANYCEGHKVLHMFQFHRPFDNPNHVNDYSWSWLEVRMHESWVTRGWKRGYAFAATCGEISISSPIVKMPQFYAQIVGWRKFCCHWSVICHCCWISIENIVSINLHIYFFKGSMHMGFATAWVCTNMLCNSNRPSCKTLFKCSCKWPLTSLWSRFINSVSWQYTFDLVLHKHLEELKVLVQCGRDFSGC